MSAVFFSELCENVHSVERWLEQPLAYAVSEVISEGRATHGFASINGVILLDMTGTLRGFFVGNYGRTL